ncbi:MAG: YraN family protein [Legionella sp.]|nr:YraN family protein [Legionella sp.]
MSLQIGYEREEQARNYLTKQGLRFITSNYRCRWGEVDLIMSDASHLIFVEVRARVSGEYGGAIGSITRQKQRKILKTASHYMVSKNLYNKYAARFDVVSLQGTIPHIEWIKNAFDSDF